MKGLESLFMRHHTSRRVTQKTVKGSAVASGNVPADGSQTSGGASENILEILQIIDDSLQEGVGEGKNPSPIKLKCFHGIVSSYLR